MPEYNHQSYSRDQEWAQRRGFVLGLTLAEAALLLLFVILLVMVIGFDRRERRIAELAEHAEALRLIAEEFGTGPDAVANDLVALREARQAFDAAGFNWDQDFRELVKALQATEWGESPSNLLDSLAEYEQNLEHLTEQFAHLEEEEDIGELVELAKKREIAADNLRGQVRQLQNQLERAGMGKVLPSCWSNSEGRTEYLMQVVLESDGIRAREIAHEHRQEERAMLPMEQIEEIQHFQPTEFLSHTRGLFDWSVDNECRFYVEVYDATAPHEKEKFIDLMLTVEGHFYKRQMRDEAPF